MLRYKLLFTFRRNNLEASNLQKIDDLENEGMIDMMFHQKQRFLSTHNNWINQNALWQKWIRS